MVEAVCHQARIRNTALASSMQLYCQAFTPAFGWWARHSFVPAIE